jgi:hypothetical protein
VENGLLTIKWIVIENNVSCDKKIEIVNTKIENGKSVILWKDSWNSVIGQDLYPHLHSFARN